MASGLRKPYLYETPWQAYSLAWAARADPRFRFAIGSFLEADKNFVQVVELNQETQTFEKIAEMETSFPQTKMMWKPTEGTVSSTDFDGGILAMCAVGLEIHKLEDGKLTPAGQMKPAHRMKDGCKSPPLTSLDWNPNNEAKIGISSIDTTCSIFDLERQKIESQLIAHDRAVYDFAFGSGSLFGTVGADGSLRIFDSRNLSVSTILWETQPMQPLFRLAWNKMDRNYLAVTTEQGVLNILDMRRPSCVFKDSSSLGLNANCVSWAPHLRHHLIWGTDDGQALIWDINQDVNTMFSYQSMHQIAPQEFYQVQWPQSATDHVALSTSSYLEVLRT